MSYFSCFFYGVNETLTYFLFQMNFVCQPSREIFHPLHFDLHMQMLEQQISGSQSKVLGVVLRYHPQLRMEGGIVGDTQCKAIQFVLLAVVVKVGKMDTDLLLTHNGYMLGGGNIETAVIAVPSVVPTWPPPEEVNGSDVPSTTAGMYFQNCPSFNTRRRAEK